MVPASLSQLAARPVLRWENGMNPPATCGPANIPLAVRAQLRTLLVRGGLLGALGLLVLLGHVWVRLKVVEAGYRLSATRQLVERLEREGRELRVRAAAADAPEHLASIARARLGMRQPQRGEEVALP